METMKLPHRRQFLHLAGVAALALAFSAVLAQAQSLLPRTIRMMVPYPPGGTADIVARLLAERIARMRGPTIVVENRPGAGTLIATEAVARAAPDGGTLLINSPEFVINPALRKQNYDPLISFEPICHLANSPTVIIVNSDSPYTKLSDLLDAARSKPHELTIASTGIFQIAIEMLKRTANVDLTFVPYQGNAPASNALLGGHVTSVFAVYPTVAELVKSGKARVLAAAAQSRIESLPDVPTIVESGYEGFVVDVWVGLMAPAKTPQAVVSELSQWFTEALQSPEVKGRLSAMETYPVAACGGAFQAYIQRQFEETTRIVREANIKAD
jgi:tripartite-type tricarboxylate transporter receptor subunit TctC